MGESGNSHPLFEFCECEQDLRLFASSLQPTVSGVHAFLLSEYERNADAVEQLGGLFLSLLYPRVKETVITYDLPLLLNDIGYRLPSDKLLLATSTTRDRFGEQSSGVVVALAPTGDGPGNYASGIVITTAPVGVTRLPHHSDGGVLVLHGGAQQWSCGESDDAGDGYVVGGGAVWGSIPYDLREDTWRETFGTSASGAVKLLEPPELRECIDQIVADCVAGPERLLTQYGPTPATTISAYIRGWL